MKTVDSRVTTLVGAINVTEEPNSLQQIVAVVYTTVPDMVSYITS